MFFIIVSDFLYLIWLLELKFSNNVVWGSWKFDGVWLVGDVIWGFDL